MRRSLTVQLPLEVTLPQLPPPGARPIIQARALQITTARQTLGAPSILPLIDLQVSRDRWAITGPNGCGKSSLLETLLGNRPAKSGQLQVHSSKIGYISQNAENWQKPQSLLHELCFTAADMPRAADLLAAHHFPMALAERPLTSLSPGERFRAALLLLFERRPPLELLVLDEPTNHLDLVAIAALEHTLTVWSGGLLVVSHDRQFLSNVGIEHYLSCDVSGGKSRPAP